MKYNHHSLFVNYTNLDSDTRQKFTSTTSFFFTKDSEDTNIPTSIWKKRYGNQIAALKNRLRETKMKIKIESEKIIKAVKKLDGIEIVLENLEDAREAINLILIRTGLFEKHSEARVTDVKVSSFQKYETTAVDYKMIFLLEFAFEENVTLDQKVSAIKELQDFFSKV